MIYVVEGQYAVAFREEVDAESEEEARELTESLFVECPDVLVWRSKQREMVNVTVKEKT